MLWVVVSCGGSIEIDPYTLDTRKESTQRESNFVRRKKLKENKIILIPITNSNKMRWNIIKIAAWKSISKQNSIGILYSNKISFKQFNLLLHHD